MRRQEAGCPCTPAMHVWPGEARELTAACCLCPGGRRLGRFVLKASGRAIPGRQDYRHGSRYIRIGRRLPRPLCPVGVPLPEAAAALGCDPDCRWRSYRKRGVLWQRASGWMEPNWKGIQNSFSIPTSETFFRQSAPFPLGQAICRSKQNRHGNRLDSTRPVTHVSGGERLYHYGGQNWASFGRRART